MSELPRKKIDELLTLYSLEKTIFDIFVEGACDKRLLNWFLENSSTQRQWQVYTIDTIDVSGDTVRKWNLTPSNKTEVIVLCSEIHEKGDYSKSVAGVIDS